MTAEALDADTFWADAGGDLGKDIGADLVAFVRAFEKGAARALLSACPNGHEYNDENTLISSRGSRRCRTCRRAAEARRPPRPRRAV